MSLRFPYRLTPTGRLIPSLPGRSVRPRPVVLITVIGPRGSRSLPATFDTGADDTVFPISLAANLGVDLTNSPRSTARGVATSAIQLHYAEATLRLTDDQTQCEWEACVAFAPITMPRALLGFAGCLQYFTATFHGDVEELELAANPLFPGTCTSD